MTPQTLSFISPGGPVRAISLWQPWASAIALGFKTFETRHWQTNHRGPLVIHAAKRPLCAVGRRLARLYAMDVEAMPFGALVLVCNLTGCFATQSFVNIPAGDADFGDFTDGRFAWKLENPRVLQGPIPYTGRQGFFSVPEEVLNRRSAA